MNVSKLLKINRSDTLPEPKVRKFDAKGFIKAAEKARKVLEKEEREYRGQQLSSSGVV